MKEKVLVSACLLGKNVKYNGKNNFHPKVANFLDDKEFFLVCPEVMGGLSTPRLPSELTKSANYILKEKKGVINTNKDDVSAYFIKGAEEALKIVLDNNIQVAILKENSPSCGVKYRYNGEFNHTLVEENGILYEMLKKLNVKILTEKDFD